MTAPSLVLFDVDGTLDHVRRRRRAELAVRVRPAARHPGGHRIALGGGRNRPGRRAQDVRRRDRTGAHRARARSDLRALSSPALGRGRRVGGIPRPRRRGGTARAPLRRRHHARPRLRRDGGCRPREARPRPPQPLLPVRRIRHRLSGPYEADHDRDRARLDAAPPHAGSLVRVRGGRYPERRGRGEGRGSGRRRRRKRQPLRRGTRRRRAPITCSPRWPIRSRTSCDDGREAAHPSHRLEAVAGTSRIGGPSAPARTVRAGSRAWRADGGGGGRPRPRLLQAPTHRPDHLAADRSRRRVRLVRADRGDVPGRAHQRHGGPSGPARRAADAQERAAHRRRGRCRRRGARRARPDGEFRRRGPRRDPHRRDGRPDPQRRQHRDRGLGPRPGHGVRSPAALRRARHDFPVRVQHRRHGLRRSHPRPRSGRDAVHRQLEDLHHARDDDQRGDRTTLADRRPRRRPRGGREAFRRGEHRRRPRRGVRDRSAEHVRLLGLGRRALFARQARSACRR